MQRIILAGISLGIAVTFTLVEAQAQNRARRGAVVGGLTGAAIGGATGGSRGALVGGAVGLGVGTLVGGQMERRRGNHFWYNGRCWIRTPANEFLPVSNRYCR